MPHIFHFFVMRRDTLQIKQLKLKILALLADKDNINFIMDKFGKYAASVEPEFASFAVKMMGRNATSKIETLQYVLNTLVRLMVRTEGAILNEAVFTISHLLR